MTCIVVGGYIPYIYIRSGFGAPMIFGAGGWFTLLLVGGEGAPGFGCVVTLGLTTGGACALDVAPCTAGAPVACTSGVLVFH